MTRLAIFTILGIVLLYGLVRVGYEWASNMLGGGEPWDRDGGEPDFV